METEVLHEILNSLKTIAELALAFLVGVGGYLVQRKLTSSTVKKQDSEASSEISSAAIELVKPLREELEQLRRELKYQLKNQQVEINRLHQFEVGVRILIAQLERLNVIPDWYPPEEEENKDEQIRNSTSDKNPSRKRTQ